MTTGVPDGAASKEPEPSNVFAAELERWRDVRGHSRASLAKAMGYDRSYVSKVLSGTERPSESFAAQAEAALRAGGALQVAFRDFEVRRPARTRPLTPSNADSPAATGGLVVEHDDATLSYEDGVYRLTQRRHLVNRGVEPITRYLIRISVDRFPGDPERSNQLYGEDPLTWDEIDLHAWHGRRATPMTWAVHHDRAAFKEVWLLFAGDRGHFPLYPGESCWIEYEYTVSEHHWGNWFQRAVRLPTRTLSVCLDFPSDLSPAVWGLHTSMTAQAMPFATAISRNDTDDRSTFSWSCEDPPLHARYRLEWDFRSHPDHADGPPPAPSATMAALGIVQDSAPTLRRVARRFDLPAEAEDARRVVTELNAACERVAQAHTFGKGMGIAAPQIGVDRAAAIVRTPDGQGITLFNPTIIEESGDTDEQYEGCLSFFDVRGQVPRPHVIHVEHTTIDGRTKITVFERGVARLVAHEVDHLHGHLYIDRMRQGVVPIPVEQYRGTGSAWKY